MNLEDIEISKSYQSDNEEMDKWNNIEKACWVGYEQRGMKDKGGRMVPNCVPVGKSDEKEVKKEYENCGCEVCKAKDVMCKDCPKCSEEMSMGKSYYSDNEDMDKWDNIQKACWDGYEQQGMKDKGGRKVPNCVYVGKADESESEDVDNQIEKASTKRLKELVDAYNKNKEGNKRISVGTLQAVYRRGIGAYRTNPGSVRPNVSSPQQWAMGRVNAFMAGLRGRFPSKSFDLDLFPKGHPRATKKSLFENFAKDVDRTQRVVNIFPESKTVNKNTDGWGGSIFDINPFKK